MKNLFLVLGIGASAYAFYLLTQKKKSACGCKDKKSSSDQAYLAPANYQIYADNALEDFDTRWHTLFNSPIGRLGQGPLPLEGTDTFKGHI